MDWDHFRYFLELARAGTLAGAARRLDVEHTTVSRRLQALEKQVGVALFAREAGGHRLTEAGRQLLPKVEAMEAAFLANDIVGQIWANRGNVSLYEYSGGTAGAVLSPWVQKVEGTLPGAADNPPTIEVDGSVITVTVRWQHPEEANLDPKPEPHSHSVVAVMDYNDD